jgi:4-oxalomesaconate tautomerase
LSFLDAAGSMCGSLLPTGNEADRIDGIELTCIDNGMPIVVMRASDLGRTGYETRDELDKDTELKARVEAIRLKVGPMMNLGDVTDKTVPKMFLVAPPRAGGVICTRSYIPHRAHAGIGVFAALSAATACLLPGSPAHALANIPEGRTKRMLVEHPTGASPVSIAVEDQDGRLVVTEAALISTARPLFVGQVLIPGR